MPRKKDRNDTAPSGAPASPPLATEEFINSIEIETRATGLPAIKLKLYGPPGHENDMIAAALDLFYRTRRRLRRREREFLEDKDD